MTPDYLAGARDALTALAKEHANRANNNGLIGDMHLLAQQRAEAYRDAFYPER